MRASRYLIVAISFTAWVPLPALGQFVDTTSTVESDRVAFFIDCSDCDLDYLRRKIAYVDYVRDREDADVHLMVTSQRGGAGREFTLFFLGQDRFSGIRDTLTVGYSYTDTEDERREALTRQIELGLIRYVARTPTASKLRIRFDRSRATDRDGRQNDKWDYWVFRIGMNGNATAEESVNSFYWRGRMNADRVTEEWKIRLAANGTYREQNYDLGDGETVKSVVENGEVSGMIVNSLGSRWSLGTFAELTTSSFRNTNLHASFAPALEFNVFPYRESSHRAFTLGYFLSLEAYDYEKVTVFDKTEQLVLRQRLESKLQFVQPWGSGSGVLSFSNYLTDFSQNLTDLYRFGLYGYLEVRITRGLSFTVEADMSRIHDQIFLPKKEASPEDILLGTIQLPTNYYFYAAIGLSYRFGSIYNNIVNPRFGI